MTHLTPDAMVDAVEGVLDSTGHAHLDACAACRGEVDRLSATLSESRSVAVPEPSPLFWEHFSQRVRTAIAEEPDARVWPLWLRWPVLAPLAALGLLVIALMTAVPRVPDTALELASTAATTNDPPSVADPEAELAMDSAWAFIEESVGPLDVETAQQAGIAASLGEAERAALHLTDAEQVELVKLLEQELTRQGS